MSDDEDFAETELGAPTFDLDLIGPDSNESQPAQSPRDAPSVLLDEPEAPTTLDGFSRGPEPVQRSLPREAAAARAEAPRALPPTAKPSPAGSDAPLYGALAIIIVLIVGLVVAAVVVVVLEFSE